MNCGAEVLCSVSCNPPESRPGTWLDHNITLCKSKFSSHGIQGVGGTSDVYIASCPNMKLGLGHGQVAPLESAAGKCSQHQRLTHDLWEQKLFLFSCNKYRPRAPCKLSSFNRQQIRYIEPNLILGGIMTTWLQWKLRSLKAVHTRTWEQILNAV